MSKVLVVEDSSTDLVTITSYLKDAGFQVTTAQSCEEAEVKLADTKPDLIILDIVLPGQSGFEFCRELKTNPSTSSIPVVLCSTKNSSVDRMWGQELGADAHLAKPVDKDTLLGTLQKLAF